MFYMSWLLYCYFIVRIEQTHSIQPINFHVTRTTVNLNIASEIEYLNSYFWGP